MLGMGICIATGGPRFVLISSAMFRFLESCCFPRCDSRPHSRFFKNLPDLSNLIFRFLFRLEEENLFILFIFLNILWSVVIFDVRLDSSGVEVSGWCCCVF